MALNSELKSRRVAAGLTQQALAARIGIDHATISHVEKGRRAPSVAVLEGWVRETGGAPVVFDAHNAPGTEADDHDAAVQGPWKAWMQRARLNQAKVAEKTGISQSMISKVFAGKCRPSVPTLSALCSVLGLSSEEAIQAIGSKIADSAGGDVRIVADPVPRSIVADLRASAAARTSGPSAQKPRDHAWSIPGPVGDLKKIRTRAGLTQSETAARMGVPASTFAAWENGQNEPSWQNLTMWAAALGWHLNHGFSPAAQQWTELPSTEQAAK